MISNDVAQHTYRILADAIARNSDETYSTFGESVITVEA